jgi:hypothetical protein
MESERTDWRDKMYTTNHPLHEEAVQNGRETKIIALARASHISHNITVVYFFSLSHNMVPFTYHTLGFAALPSTYHTIPYLSKFDSSSAGHSLGKIQATTMSTAQNSNNPETPRGSSSSIAALRQILMLDTPTRDILNDKHNAVQQQARYQEQQRYTAEMKGQLDQIKDLKKRVKDLQTECETERSMRKTLETTYEALSNHKKELTLQLELVSKARQHLEQKLEASGEGGATSSSSSPPSTETDKAVKKARQLENELTSARREVEELKRKNILLVAQGSGDKDKQNETLEAYAATNERLKKRTEENEDKLYKVQTEVSLMIIYTLCAPCYIP